VRTAARVVLLAAGLAAVAWAFGGQTDTPRDLEAERTEFATRLREYRSGRDDALAALLSSAERMAQFERADARDVAAFFQTIPVEERRAGLDSEERYDRLRAEVFSAAERDISTWPMQRTRILVDLDALIAERRDAPDPTPAARALALAAILEEQRARVDPDLSRAQRDEWLARAASRAHEALAIFERAKLLTPTFEPAWLLARIDDANGDLNAARVGFEDCLELAERVAIDDYRVRALRGLVAVAEGTGDLAEQRVLMRELATIRAPKDDWWLAHRWASILVAEDEGEAAVRFLRDVRPRTAEETNAWHFLYGSALQRLGRFDEAREHLDQVKLRPETQTDCAALGVRVLSAQSALARGDAAQALAIAEPVADRGCTAAMRAQRALTIGAAHLALGDSARAEAALRTAIDLGRAIETRLARSDDGSVFGEVVGMETFALLADALTRQGRPLEAIRIAEQFQARALRGRDDLEIGEDDLRAWAKGFERGLITWIVGADTTVVAHAGAGGSAVAFVIPLGREVLHEAIRRAREAAIAGDEERARRLAAEIESRVVPAELRERVAGPGRLLVLAHGPLERLPFDLVTLADAGPIAVLPGLASARPGEAPDRSAYAQWSILGDPTSPEGRGVLPGALAEVKAIADVLGAKAKSGDDFDRLALVDALKSGRPLHVATHLVRGCGDVPHDSGLLLARGAVLCAREIREIAPGLPIAVLAACETAEGRFVDAQVLDSVANAFLASGTRNLCVTLWPVEDGAARRWSEAFHAELARGTRPAEAARRAVDALRRDGTPVSEWAAFRFVGRD
jgi:tetratricopeptide (TPR) repeat protein